MKKIIIIGATGSLAAYVIEAVRHLQSVELTLFVRNKDRLSKDLAQDIAIIEGDALIFEDLKQAIKGQDIVYLNLAGDLETMTKNVISAMQETGVKRIIATSSIGIYKTPLKAVLTPYRKLADLIENSEVDYTILRPDWFTHTNEIDYTLTKKGEPETGTAVSRKSIADFIVKIINDPTLHQHENLGISKPG